MTRKRRTALIDELDALPPDAPRVVLSTGELVGEGFDRAPLDTLVLAVPISWKGTLARYAGRLHREHANKSSVRIIDFVDEGHPALLRMREARRRSYQAMGCRILAAPLGGGLDLDAIPPRDSARPTDGSIPVIYTLNVYTSGGSSVADKTAKLFVNGGSQAVRLPAEFRFDNSDEVYIRRDAVTGDVIFVGHADQQRLARFLRTARPGRGAARLHERSPTE
jgi:superfamily II DNA or RNA helicase